MTFSARNLTYRINDISLLREVDLDLRPGEIHALLGPNGSGKSTLLRLLAGEIRAQSGHITLNGKSLRDWTALEQAQQRAVLPQSDHLHFAFTAEQVVALGRMPCIQHRPAQERMIVQEALKATDALHLAGHTYPTLSGGERARVQLARILAQVWEPVTSGPRYLLLDEPTANLDLLHQHQCLKIARKFASEDAGVLVVLHDLNLALTYADHITLISEGAVVASGAPEEVLTESHIKQVYGVRSERLQSENTGMSHIAVIPS